MSTSGDTIVLDLTFRDIKEEADLSHCLDELMNPKAASSPGKRKKKDDVKGLKLNNNEVSNLTIICNPISSILIPSYITWLDLSFNAILSINVDLAEFLPNLATFYLHANQISKLSEIRKLQQFPLLKSVTLYGNPVEENKHYRNMALFCCPALVQLDFGTITAQQKDKMQTWTKIYHKKLFPEDA